MAVEARHISLFPSQLLTDRPNLVINGDIYNNALLNSALPPSMPPQSQSLLPFHQSPLCDPNSAKSSMNNNNKSDSGLTFHHLPRKRFRDSDSELNVLPQRNLKLPSSSSSPSSSSFLDQDVLHQIRNHQSEIDHFIAQHTEKVRMELEERRIRQSRILHSAIQEAMSKRLKEKDEEIQKMGKLNRALQERVKSLCVENQIWREMAHTNEATANSLRTNLEQVLAAAQVDEDRRAVAPAAEGGGAAAADAESSCGSNDEGRQLAGAGDDTAASGGVGGGGRVCRRCGVRESIVLLLPCRHLCVCTMCGSTCRSCPVCDSGINASVHVNFS